MALNDSAGKKAPVILIGGIPGVGKSSISGYLAKNIGIDIVLSGDYLREFARPLVHGEQSNLLSVSVYEAWKMFGTESRETIEKGFLAQAELLNKGLEAVLSRAIRNGEPIIVETLYFVPSQLSREVLRDIIPLYIYISEKDVNSSRLMERQKYTHFTSPGKRLSDQLDRYRVMMDYSLGECRNLGIAAFDNMDYASTRDQILQHVKSLI